MNSIDERIITLINEHHVLTLASTNNNIPWVCSCFYTYDSDRNAFIFTSDLDTQHAKEMHNNKDVAIAIALETKMVGNIRGLQINAKARLLEGEDLKSAKKKYLKSFPIAMLSKTTLWGAYPSHIKMTDNRLGFGKKLIWDLKLSEQ